MEDIIIRNIEEKDIPDVVDIKINGWKSAYKGIVDDNILNSMNRNERIEKKSKNRTKMILWCLKDNEPSKKFCTKMGGRIIKERKIEIGEKEYLEVGFEYNI